MLAFWSLTVWAIWRLAEATGLKQYAWLVLLVMAWMPSAIQMSIEPLTQQPVSAFLLLAIGAAVRAIETRAYKEYVLLGIALACLGLTRPSTLPFLVLLPVFAYWRSGKEYGRRSFAGPVLSLGLALALVFGWVAKTHRDTGAWMINNSNAVNLYFGNNPWTPLYRTWYFGSQAKPGSAEIHQFPEYERTVTAVNALPPLEASRTYKHLAVEYMKGHPGVFFLRTLNRIQCFFGFDIFTSANLRSQGGLGRRVFVLSMALEVGLYLLIAAPSFFWIAARNGLWREWQALLMAGVIVVYAAPYWLSMSHPTYHYAIVVPLAVLGLFAWKNGSGKIRASRGWAAVGLLSAIQLVWLFEMIQSFNRHA
jgi:hypothetical protein